MPAMGKKVAFIMFAEVVRISCQCLGQPMFLGKIRPAQNYSRAGLQVAISVGDDLLSVFHRFFCNCSCFVDGLWVSLVQRVEGSF